MKNIKEIQPILTALYCINFTGNRDDDINRILEYAFKSILGCNTNMLTLSCIGKLKDEIMPDIIELLKQETNYPE